MTEAEGPVPAAETLPAARRPLVKLVQPILPILPLVFVVGATFGILARTAGLGAPLTIFISATTFAGAAQFALLSLLTGGAGLAAAVLTAVMINSRFLPMGLAVGPSTRGRFWRRLLQSHVLVDENWALSRRADGDFDTAVLLAGGIVLYAVWVLATAAGAISGLTIPDPKRLGIDGAFPALFLALLLPLKDRLAVVAAAFGATIALLLSAFTPAGLAVLAAATASLLGVMRRPTRA